jgi:hypothetical protein
MQKYDPKSAWWNFCAVGNYAGRFYSYAMQPVRSLQRHFEGTFVREADLLEQSLVASNPEELVSKLTAFTVESGQQVSARWALLLPELLTTYRDGYVIGGQQNATVTITRMFYPRWWLQTVGFFAHPANRDGILFASNPKIEQTQGTSGLFVLVMALGFFVAGWWLGRRGVKRERLANYSSIPDQV